MGANTALLDAVRHFHALASQLWSDYLSGGPGFLEDRAFWRTWLSGGPGFLEDREAWTQNLSNRSLRRLKAWWICCSNLKRPPIVLMRSMRSAKFVSLHSVVPVVWKDCVSSRARRD